MSRNDVGMNLCYKCGISPHLYYIHNSDVWAVACKNPDCDEYDKPIVGIKSIIAEQEWNKRQEFRSTMEKLFGLLSSNTSVEESVDTENVKNRDYSKPYNIHEYDPPTTLLVHTTNTDTYEAPITFTNVSKYYYMNGCLCIEHADSIKSEYLDILAVKDVHTIDELYKHLELER